jgi:tetratricopeptide (TPR) repeat protein
MFKSRLLFAMGPLMALCACATPGPGPVVVGTSPPRATESADVSAGDSAYGLFLAGEAAVNKGQGATAAAYFDRAAGLDPGEPAAFLDTHAFSALLLAGDITRAAANAPTDPSVEPVIRRLGALTQGVEALASGDPKRAYAKLAGPDVGAPYEGVAQLLAPFAAAAAGDFRAATVHPVIEGEPIAQFYASLDQGKLYEHFHHDDEAETAFRALITGGDPGGIASLALGALLERRGRSAEAAAIYATAMTRNPTDSSLDAARARALARKPPPPEPTIRQSAAEALVAPATVLIIQKQYEVGLAYLRLALRLDPGRDEAWVLVGDILGNIGDEDGARAAYMTPKAGTPEYLTARGKLAWSYQDAGEKDKALAIARAAHASAPTDQEAATTLADLFRADERYDESVKVLDPIIQKQGDRADWRLLYMRAVDLQESDRWADAERDLSRALAANPDEPELLNFLGYAWIDRGENLPRALAMVKKAVSLDPQSGAMVDSLGWAYYRLGDYRSAVEQLESAVVLEAGDAEINDHLGDAYWRVGRRTEAQFQWRRVLTLEPTPKLKASVEAKLKSGLDAPGSPSIAGS